MVALNGIHLGPLVPRQLRQMLAKKNGGQESSRANPVGTALPLPWSYSRELVISNKHLNCGLSGFDCLQMREWHEGAVLSISCN